MLIILEGPDGAGKTTLANEIIRFFTGLSLHRHEPIELLHKGPCISHPLDEYELPLINYRPGAKHIVCDRWHLGEAIYPAILKRNTKWDVAIDRHIELFLRSRGACQIGLTATSAELMSRLELRGDDLVDQVQVLDIAYDYYKLRRRFDLSNFDDFNALITPKMILSRAAIRARRAVPLNKFVTYVGPPAPQRLVFGDVRHANALKLRPNMPAFCPYSGTSGHYLLTHLDVLGFDVGLANACDVDDPVALWKAVGLPVVTALGRNACAKLCTVGLPHNSVPHPQYIRRFHHDAGPEYAKLILSTRGEKDLTSWRPS